MVHENPAEHSTRKCKERKKKKRKNERGGVTDAGLGRNGKWSAGRLARTLHTQRPDGIE